MFLVTTRYEFWQRCAFRFELAQLSYYSLVVIKLALRLTMEGLTMISDIAWIQRGVAKKTPDKVKLDEEQLKQLIVGRLLIFVQFCHQVSYSTSGHLPSHVEARDSKRNSQYRRCT